MSHSPEQKSDNSLIQEALAHFGLTGASVLPIRHNENIICKVSAPSGNYCLRIHAPT